MTDDREQYKSLGALYAASREEARISIEKAAAELRIPSRILAALEAGAYAELPPDAFSRGIVAKYAGFLKLDRAECMARYERERSKDLARPQSGSRDLLPHNRFSSKPILWFLGAKELAGAAAIAGFVYLFWQLSGFLMPPSIVLVSPAQDFTVTQANILTVSGLVRGTERLIINGERISGGRDGRFQARVDLVEGENIIQVSAEDLRGRAVSVTRRVWYQPLQEMLEE